MNKKDFWANFWNTNSRISHQRVKLAKDNPNSIKLGVWGLICCALCLAFGVGVAWAVVKLFEFLFSGVYIYLIGNLMILITALALPFFYISYIVAPCLLYPIHQLILNRKPMGWISLIVGIATILVGTVGVFVLVLGFGGIINIF